MSDAVERHEPGCAAAAWISVSGGEREPRAFATRTWSPEGNGAEDWNRTSDTSIFSAVLYQLSYLGTRHTRRRNHDNTSRSARITSAGASAPIHA